MEKPKPSTSPIHIDEISLLEVIFKRKDSKLSKRTVPLNWIKLSVQIECQDELRYKSLFMIEIGEESLETTGFYVKLSYEIFSHCNELSFKDKLIAFAKIGASFNALVHARETLASLSVKAFGKPILLPLLDITIFGQVLTITTIEVSKEKVEEEKNATRIEPTQ